MGAGATTTGCALLRGQARCEAILQATLDVLSEVGFERMTIDGVAARAHASKATIYRNWEGKADLVAEALGQWPGAELRAPDTGSLRGDLLAVTRLLHDRLNSRYGTLFAGLLHAIQDDEHLAQAVRAQTHCQARIVYQTILDRAVERGEISGCPDPELVVSIAPALMFFRHLFTGDPVDEHLLTSVVDDILLPALDRNAR
ncbi:MAG: TetR/AcrR family transcriptional regulator [Sciscionella sp.]